MSGDLFIGVLQHPSEKVRFAALKQIQQKNIPATNKFSLPFLQNNNSAQLIAESLKIICRKKADSEIILPYLQHANPGIRKVALTGLYFYGAEEIKEFTTSTLKEMTASTEVSERLIVAEILSNQGNCT